MTKLRNVKTREIRNASVEDIEKAKAAKCKILEIGEIGDNGKKVNEIIIDVDTENNVIGVATIYEE